MYFSCWGRTSVLPRLQEERQSAAQNDSRQSCWGGMDLLSWGWSQAGGSKAQSTGECSSPPVCGRATLPVPAILHSFMEGIRDKPDMDRARRGKRKRDGEGEREREGGERGRWLQLFCHRLAGPAFPVRRLQHLGKHK